MTLPRETPPLAYVVHHHVQICRHCGRQHSYSAIYAKSNLKPVTLTGIGKPVSNLHAVGPTDVSWNVPIERTETRIVQLPFCHDCYASVTLTHCVTPPKPQAATGAKAATIAATAVVKGGYAVESTSPFNEAPAKPKREPVKAATIDDMLA